MKVKVIQSHVSANGTVPVDMVLDLSDTIAADYINARLAVAHAEQITEQATARPVEQATRRRGNIETR